jgi:hypothetical protein
VITHWSVLDLIAPSYLVAYAGEVTAAPQVERLGDAVLEVTVGRFNRAIFVSYPFVVARRPQAIVMTEVVIQPGQRFAPFAASVTIGSAEAISAVLLRRSATFKQGILQPFRQGDKALAALNHLGITPATVSQAVMIEQMLKRRAVDGNLHAF